MGFLRSVPQWLKITSDEVKDQIFKLAKKGLTPSQIGVILRDSHGVAHCKQVLGHMDKALSCPDLSSAVKNQLIPRLLSFRLSQTWIMGIFEGGC